MDAPQARYLDCDGAAFAFQVVGDGPVDVLWVGEAAQHFDLAWTDPHIHALYEEAARYSRAAYMQMRGMGLSERIRYFPTPEQQADDVIAVLDAIGMQTATLVGTLTTCGAVCLAAAKAPDRVANLVLFKALPCGPLAASALDNGWTPETAADYVAGWRTVMARWGSGATVEMWDPVLDTPYNRRLMALLERCSSTPTYGQTYVDAGMSMDNTSFLPSVQAPTRVLFAPTAREPRAVVERVADLIPNATFHVLAPTPPGASIGEAYQEVWRHVHDVATGTPQAPDARRSLGTVLFTDLVESTQLLTRLGDADYSHLRATHERQVRYEVERSSGRLVSVSGDGTFSLFDSPTRAVRTAAVIVEAARDMGVEVRAGVHTGELEHTAHNVAGLTVHIGARIAALSGPGEVLVSSTVRDLVVGSGLIFTDRGTHELKGVPGRWTLCALGEAGEHPAPLPLEPSLETPLDRFALRTARSAPGTMRLAMRVGNAVQRRRITR